MQQERSGKFPLIDSHAHLEEVGDLSETPQSITAVSSIYGPHKELGYTKTRPLKPGLLEIAENMTYFKS